MDTGYQPEYNWRAVVIFPEETVDPGVHPHYREFFETSRLRRVYLSKLAPEHLEKFPLNLLQIITVPNEDVSSVVGKVARQVSDEIQDPNLKFPLVRSTQIKKPRGKCPIEKSVWFFDPC
ncbi:MAG: DUF2887 domain-containing protein [bacterium]